MRKSVPSFQKFLRFYARELLEIKHRLYFLEAVDREFQSYAKERNGVIQPKNVTAYQTLLDSFDMLVIDLDSFCTHFVEAGGIFPQLCNYLGKLKPLSKNIAVEKPNILHFGSEPISKELEKEFEISFEQHRRDQLKQEVRSALDRLFPEWEATGKVEQVHILRLKESFVSKIKKLRADRDTHRAHRYQKDSRKKKAETEKIRLTEIREVFKEIERVFNDLFMVCDLSVMVFDSDLNHRTESTAKDLVDIAMHGSISRLFENLGIHKALTEASASQRFYHQFRNGMQFRDQARDA